MRKTGIWIRILTTLPMAFLLWATAVCGSGPAIAPGLDRSGKLTLKPLDLTRPPSTEQLMAAGQLGGPLHATHDIKSAERKGAINLSFGKAIQAWNRHEYDRAAAMFKEHIAAYPDSPWASEAVLHLGCYQYYHARYSEAESAFQWIIKENGGKRDPGARALDNKARLRLGMTRAAQDRLDEAQELFRDLKAQGHDWRHRTYASHWIQRISRYKGDRLAMLDCGAKALARLFETQGNDAAARDLAAVRPQDLKGHTLEALSEMASRHGRDLVALRLPLTDATSLPVPAIVHVGLGRARGHYWVLEKVGEDGLELLDPQSRQRFSRKPGEFAVEWSGVALVFDEDGPLPGTRLTRSEMGSVFGGCCGVPRPPDNTGDPDDNEGPGPPPKRDCGAPRWSVNMVNMNIFMTDTPLWYSPPIGPPVEISISYNSLSSITFQEPFGNKWQFSLGSYLVVDPSGTVTLFMPDGAVDQYEPDGKGGYTAPSRVYNRLTKLAENSFELLFPNGWVYAYMIPAGTGAMQPFLVEIRDAHQQKLTLGYNTNVQLTTVKDALGKITTIAYGVNGLVSRVTDPFGRYASFRYDSDFNLVGITDMAGYATNLSYDNDIYLTGIQSSRGEWGVYVEPADGLANDFNRYPPPGGLMWEDYRITVTDPLGGKAEYYYNGYSSYAWYVSPRDYRAFDDPAGSNWDAPKITYKYTTVAGRGEISKIVLQEGGVVEYGYDSMGNRSRITDAHGHNVYFTYNSMGMPASRTDPRGVTTQFIYASNDVDLLQVRNGLGSIARTYNSFHEVTSLQDRAKHPPWAFTWNIYGQPATVKDPLGVLTVYVYDASHRLIQIKRAGSVIRTFTYDTIGRVATVTDATGLKLAYVYDKLNAVKRITYPDGKYVAYTYSNCCPYLVDQVTKRSGRTVKYEYDALLRLSRVTDFTGKPSSIQYDANGNITMLLDKQTNTTHFRYDLDNRLVEKTYSDGGSIRYEYDKAGFPTERVNARGIATSYGFDDAHNLVSVSYSDNTPGVTYTYDDFGRVKQRRDAAGTWSFAYDADSRLITLNGPLTNDAVVYGYDALGRRNKVTAQGGKPVSYFFDTLGRLSSVQMDTKAFSFTYSGANPLVQSMTRPDGGGTFYQYDTLRRLTLISHKDSAGAVIRQFSFSRNAQDLIAEEDRGDGNPVLSPASRFTQYQYNDLNQLLRSTNPERAYLYDPDGNLLQGYTPQGYLFKAAYDAENRMKSLSYTETGGPSRVYRYVYGADGVLASISRYDNGTLAKTTKMVNSGFLRLQERDGNNVIERQYFWKPGNPGGIGGLLQFTQSGEDYSYLFDGRGNISAVLNGTQSVVAAYEYDGYGIPLSTSGTLDQPFRFSTKAYDTQTGLSYYGLRYYSPALGKWTTRDPLGERGGINLYRFAADNPTTYRDPLGLAPGDPYNTPSDAARAALDDVIEASMNANIEIGGKIYQMPDGKYYYSEPVSDDSENSVNVGKARIPDNADMNGYYHTHGRCDKKYDSENFSWNDKEAARYYDGNAYLLTPDGVFKSYDPNFFEWEKPTIIEVPPMIIDLRHSN